MNGHDYTVGERVYYVLPRSPKSNRPRDLYWAARVTRVTGRRIVIVLDGSKRSHPRNTVSANITRTPPADAWVKP